MSALNRVKGELIEVSLKPHKKYGYWYREDTSDRAMMKDCRDHYRVIYDSPDLVGATVLDLGANIGYFSSLCLDYGAKKVVLVEADDGNCSVIEANLRPDDPKVSILHAAVVPDSYTDPTITFYTGNSDQSSCSGSTLVSRARGNSFTAQAIRISDLLEKHRPEIIKCDIEGGEFHVFENLVIPDYVKMVALEVHESSEWMKAEVSKLLAKFDGWEIAYRNENIVFGKLYATDIVFRRV